MTASVESKHTHHCACVAERDAELLLAREALREVQAGRLVYEADLNEWFFYDGSGPRSKRTTVSSTKPDLAAYLDALAGAPVEEPEEETRTDGM